MGWKTIYLRVTDTCNLNCDHCFTSGSKGLKNVFDHDKTVTWIREWSQRNSRDHLNVLLHGGEPFLVDISRFEELVEELSDVKIEWGIVSNLTTKLTDRHIAFIKEHCDGCVGTSWDLDIRFDTERVLKKWHENLKLMKDNDIKVQVNVSVTRSLLEVSLPELYETWLGFGCDNLVFERITDDGNAVENNYIKPRNIDLDKWFYDLYLYDKEMGNKVPIENFHILQERITSANVKTHTSCRTCEQNITTMRADGGLSGCPNRAHVTHAYLDDGYDIYIGSEKRMDAIVHEAGLDPRCITCDVFDVCGSDCHQLSWDDTGCPGYKTLLRYLKKKTNKSPMLINLTEIR